MISGVLTVYWREMIRFFRFRGLLISSLVQPALWMAFFGVAMSSTLAGAGLSPLSAPAGTPPVDYLTFIAPGVIAMTALFTGLFGGLGLLFDRTFGLMPELLASPIPRSHIIAGIGMAGLTKAVLQCCVVLGFGWLIGVTLFPGFSVLQALLSFGGLLVFVSIFSLGFIFLSSAIALRMESHEGLQAVMTLLSLPLFFTSNALYPTTAFPPLLKAISMVNPLTYLTTGIRYCCLGSEFSVIGRVYVISFTDVLVAFTVLILFAGIMGVAAVVAIRRVPME